MTDITANALVSNSLPVLALNALTPLGSLDAYIGAVHKIPVLSAEDEQDLARRFRDDEDLDAARELVHSHLRFVVHVARGYNGYGLPLGDLIQEGNIGLMKAVKRFDPDQGVRLVSFAVHWIRAEMHEFILKNWRIVKVATTKAQRKLFFNLRKSKKRLGWMNDAEVTAVAADLNVSKREVLEMESRLSGRDIGFDAPAGEDDDHAPPSPVSYLRADAEDPSQMYEREDEEDSQLSLLREGLAKLDERSRDIVARRWLGNENKVTLQELADEYGVSAERIRQIEANALKKMRALFAA
ncbi:RNA polymerase factor sigma-32 [Lysobacter arseniciresistens ZS79]|uniref:RNA polymerase sigma factor RpoH n=1 Tax=Lysobacter arseniciresistens ZS79 TaxID=913325 RepID=A0A0A0EQB0_9GAMM|nr:RNA polymerase sigma factor RpoH [Lysobacter arseniciresistens]KGM53181.1 RNA polymerase factor sigma-32 [Lysobacter arseniciresistens ZS79]